ncbi:TonB-dependent receptor [candidate division KSB1 bacterium]|nr:TonB-dependent receptor [candidate division KSB1 bacterium]
MSRTLSIVFLAAFVTSVAIAQTNRTATVSGFIYDASNGEALIGANVFLENTLLGSSTNLNGYYVIPKIPVGESILIVDYIGYKQFKRKLILTPGDKKVVTVSLEVGNIQMEKVVVTGEALTTSEKLFRKPISKIELTPRQIKQMPQVAEADLLRSLQTLPGILPVSDFSSALYVRGGTPDQNLHLIDGTEIYNPEHAFGLFSTFNMDAIKKVELSKGGFGAQYGGRLSSILNVTNLDGNREEFEGTGSISLLSAKTTVQMPIGTIGSLSGSFRRTYFDKTIAKAIDDVPNYYFYDGNVKAFFDINDKNKLTISGYGGEDVLDLTFNNNASEDVGFNYDWGNTTGSIRWTRVISPRLFANFWITGSRFESDFDFGDTVDFLEKNFVSDITFKGHFEYHLSTHFTTNFGFEQKNLHLIFLQDFPGGKINIDKRPKHYVAFVQQAWRPNLRWDIEAGMRYNFFDADENFQKWAPRFSAKYRLTDSINLKAATGLYYQFLHRIRRAFIADIWTASNRFQKESSSFHAILGFQKELNRNWELEIEGFYKDYNNIYSFNENVLTELSADAFENGEPVYTETRGVFNRGDGETKGVELMLRKDFGAITGWLGYSLSFTKYTIDGINQGQSFSPRHDRTQALNIVGNLDLKNVFRSLRGQQLIKHRSNWKVGFTFIYTTGQPITLPGSGYFTNTLPDRETTEFEIYPAEINNFRLPPYARLDISLTYEKHFRSWSIFPYLQIFNVGNRKNVWFLDHKLYNFVQRTDVETMFPILPTIGVNFNF